MWKSNQSKGFVIEFEPTDEIIEFFREFHQRNIKVKREDKHEEFK